MLSRKNLAIMLIYLLSLLISPFAVAQPFGQVLQINTHFNRVYGKPTWLLIVRDVVNGQVSPYVFDIQENDNFWIALTYGHEYRITASSLKFGRFAVIHNFCGLENGIISGKSMFITLTGTLSPIPSSFNCRVLKYNGLPFPIANP